MPRPKFDPDKEYYIFYSQKEANFHIQEEPTHGSWTLVWPEKIKITQEVIDFMYWANSLYNLKVMGKQKITIIRNLPPPEEEMQAQFAKWRKQKV